MQAFCVYETKIFLRLVVEEYGIVRTKLPGGFVHTLASLARPMQRVRARSLYIHKRKTPAAMDGVIHYLTGNLCRILNPSIHARPWKDSRFIIRATILVTTLPSPKPRRLGSKFYAVFPIGRAMPSIHPQSHPQSRPRTFWRGESLLRGWDNNTLSIHFLPLRQ